MNCAVCGKESDCPILIHYCKPDCARIDGWILDENGNWARD